VVSGEPPGNYRRRGNSATPCAPSSNRRPHQASRTNVTCYGTKMYQSDTDVNLMCWRCRLTI